MKNTIISTIFLFVLLLSFSFVNIRTPIAKADTTAFNVNLKYGSRGAQVVALQKYLITNGFLATKATGYFGTATLKAVKNFQKKNNIPSTGFVGVLTRNLLNTIALSESKSSSSDVGKTTEDVSSSTSKTATNVEGPTPNTGESLSTDAKIQEVANPIFNEVAKNPDINPPIYGSSFYRARCTLSSRRSIDVVYPNGGEVYTSGQKVELQWTTCNYSSSKVSIYLEYTPLGASGGENYYDLAINTNDDGSEIVTLPQINLNQNTEDYRIVITDGGLPNVAVLIDKSDGAFTVK